MYPGWSVCRAAAGLLGARAGPLLASFLSSARVCRDYASAGRQRGPTACACPAPTAYQWEEHRGVVAGDARARVTELFVDSGRLGVPPTRSGSFAGGLPKGGTSATCGIDLPSAGAN